MSLFSSDKEKKYAGKQESIYAMVRVLQRSAAKLKNKRVCGGEKVSQPTLAELMIKPDDIFALRQWSRKRAALLIKW